jgi:UDP-N-acetylglucosamine acyltransferase
LIDARAIIDPRACLASDVTVGPFSVIGADVEIDAGTWVGPHVVINGPTRIGRDNKIFQFASIGEAPQDKKYAGEPTRLEIGDRNVFREYCTVNRGTASGNGYTRVGNDNLIMAYVHIAHDCVLGNHVIFANAASLAGHVTVGDHAILGGFAIVHQFCRIGAHSFCAMGSVINRDVPPYVMVSGHMAEPHGINAEGLRRRGFSAETIREIRRAYRLIYRSSLTLGEALAQLEAGAAEWPELRLLASFLSGSARGIVR